MGILKERERDAIRDRESDKKLICLSLDIDYVTVITLCEKLALIN